MSYIATYVNVCILIFLDSSSSYWDEKEILSDHYQRPYQYFLWLSDESALDEFSFGNSKSKSIVQLPASEKTILHAVLEYVYIYQQNYSYCMHSYIAS